MNCMICLIVVMLLGGKLNCVGVIRFIRCGSKCLRFKIFCFIVVMLIVKRLKGKVMENFIKKRLWIINFHQFKGFNNFFDIYF
jgi:hypothetical protein